MFVMVVKYELNHCSSGAWNLRVEVSCLFAWDTVAFLPQENIRHWKFKNEA